MNTTTFLWFAVVSSFVLVVKARLGRPRKTGVDGWPTVFYEGKLVTTRLNNAIADMIADYHVMAVMDDTEWEKYIAAIEKNLKDYIYHDISYTMESKFHGVMGLNLSPRLVRISDIAIGQMPGHTRVKLSLVIPEMSMAATGTVMLFADHIVRPCNFQFKIDYLTLVMISDWTTARVPTLVGSSITRYTVGDVRMKISFGNTVRDFTPIPKSKEPATILIGAIEAGIGGLLDSFTTDIIFY